MSKNFIHKKYLLKGKWLHSKENNRGLRQAGVSAAFSVLNAIPQPSMGRRRCGNTRWRCVYAVLNEALFWGEYLSRLQLRIKKQLHSYRNKNRCQRHQVSLCKGGPPTHLCIVHKLLYLLYNTFFMLANFFVVCVWIIVQLFHQLIFR